MSGVIDQIREAGVVGCGGAGFPTAVKLAASPQWLIVNAMECEPLLRTDRYVVRSFAPRLVAALAAIGREIGAARCVIALKETYTREIAALRAAIAASGAAVTLHTTTSFYPAGDEQVVVYEVTGRTVPPAGLPSAVGCVVINAGTLFAAAEAMEGKPFTHRHLTVTGAVAKPVVVDAPIGTSFAACVALAGGLTMEPEKLCVVAGGPMMGRQFDCGALEELFVEKTTSGILLLSKANYAAHPVTMEQVARTARAACIQCSYCTELCPRYLLGHPLEPHRIMRTLAYHRLEDVLEAPAIRAAALCCECGVCELYACPMQLKPRSVNAIIKKALAEAGLRYPTDGLSTQPAPLREARKTPSRRVAARAGVGDYYALEIDAIGRADPEQVALALKQGTGASSRPEVAVGDIVRAGQRVARCPDGALGANLHTPIAGRVTEIDTHIRIGR